MQIKESETIPSEDLDLPEEKNTADLTIQKEQQPVEEIFQELSTQEVAKVKESNTLFSESKTEESSAQESQPVEKSEIKTSQDLTEDKTKTQTTIEQTSETANEFVQETDINAEIVQKPESETKPSEQIPDEQHIAKPTTEEIPKPVTDIVEEPRSIKGKYREMKVKQNILKTESPKAVTIVADNDGAVKELGTDEQHITQTTAEETPKPVTDIVEEVRALEEERETKHTEDEIEEQKQATLIVEGDNDKAVDELSIQEVKVEESGVKSSNGKNSSESITEETRKPVGDVIEEQSTYQSLKIKESETIPSEDLPEEKTAADSTIKKGPQTVDEAFEEPCTQVEDALVYNKVFERSNTQEPILKKRTTQVSNAPTTTEEATKPEDVAIQKPHGHEVMKKSEDATDEMSSTESSTAVSEATKEASAEIVVKGRRK